MKSYPHVRAHFPRVFSVVPAETDFASNVVQRRSTRSLSCLSGRETPRCGYREPRLVAWCPKTWVVVRSSHSRADEKCSHRYAIRYIQGKKSKPSCNIQSLYVLGSSIWVTRGINPRVIINNVWRNRYTTITWIRTHWALASLGGLWYTINGLSLDPKGRVVYTKSIPACYQKPSKFAQDHWG